VVVAVPASITVEPVDVNVAAGVVNGPLLSVVAQGDGVLSYQWRRNGFPIDKAKYPQATNAQLTLTQSLTVADSGYYDVVVKNTVGGVDVSTVVSRKALVSVSGTEPTGIINAGTVRANEGESVTLTSFAAAANWTLFGGGTLDTSRTRVVSGGANLILKSVSPTDPKVYSAAILHNATLTDQW